MSRKSFFLFEKLIKDLKWKTIVFMNLQRVNNLLGVVFNVVGSKKGPVYILTE